MQDLNGECSNAVPSGLGNGNSNMDMSVFTDGPTDMSDHNKEEVEMEEAEAGSPTQWGMVMSGFQAVMEMSMMWEEAKMVVDWTTTNTRTKKSPNLAEQVPSQAVQDR